MNELSVAAVFNDIPYMKNLIQNGCDVNQTCEDATIPLHHAAENGCMEATQLLLDAGSNVETIDQRGYTPMMCAERADHKNIIELLLKNGTNPYTGPSLKIDTTSREYLEFSAEIDSMGDFLVYSEGMPVSTIRCVEKY